MIDGFDTLKWSTISQGPGKMTTQMKTNLWFEVRFQKIGNDLIRDAPLKSVG